MRLIVPIDSRVSDAAALFFLDTDRDQFEAVVIETRGLRQRNGFRGTCFVGDRLFACTSSQVLEMEVAWPAGGRASARVIRRIQRPEWLVDAVANTDLHCLHYDTSTTMLLVANSKMDCIDYIDSTGRLADRRYLWDINDELMELGLRRKPGLHDLCHLNHFAKVGDEVVMTLANLNGTRSGALMSLTTGEILARDLAFPHDGTLTGDRFVVSESDTRKLVVFEGVKTAADLKSASRRTIDAVTSHETNEGGRLWLRGLAAQGDRLLAGCSQFDDRGEEHRGLPSHLRLFDLASGTLQAKVFLPVAEGVVRPVFYTLMPVDGELSPSNLSHWGRPFVHYGWRTRFDIAAGGRGGELATPVFVSPATRPVQAEIGAHGLVVRSDLEPGAKATVRFDRGPVASPPSETERWALTPRDPLRLRWRLSEQEGDLSLSFIVTAYADQPLETRRFKAESEASGAEFTLPKETRKFRLAVRVSGQGRALIERLTLEQEIALSGRADTSTAVPSQPRPYENISTALTRLIPDFRSFIEERLAEGYVHEGIFLTDLKPPIDWNASRFTRSNRARLHAWEPINLVLAAHSQLGDDKYLEIAAAYAFDWLRRFQSPALSQPPADVLAAASSGEESFVWYDACVSYRAYRLAYIAEAIVRRGGWADEDTRLLIDALHFHQRMLAQDTIFRAHTNHGLYQALGQLAASRRLTDLVPSEGFAALARSRLETVLAQHFVADEGVHKEHSPRYQYMLLGTLIGAQEAGLLDLLESGLLDRISASLSWMIMPDASLVTFGDSDPLRVTEEAPAEQFDDPWLRHQFSGGRIGEPPPSGVKGFPKGGYAFARIYDRENGESPASATYLAQLAAFHSRVHKQADHLTFVWSEGQLPILTDPGRYGYAGRTKRGDGLYEQGFWYGDPKRIFVESTRAHNCVEIDGLSYVRRKDRAFGSALKQADLQDGCVVFDTAITHRPSLVHRRTLILAPREFLVVVDWLFDRSGEAHDFRQWFQLAPVWEAERCAGGFSARYGEARLWAIELLGGADPSTVHTGSEEPFQGWTSDAPGSLIPSPSFNFRRSGASTAAFATLFSLTGEPAADARTRVNTSLSRARLVWTSEGNTVQLNVERRDRVSVSRRALHRSRAPAAR